MLAGRKPLAMFADAEGRFPDVIVRYMRLFDRQVASGQLVRHDQLDPPADGQSYVLHRIMFALPDQRWRIDAMIELKASREWTPAHERREGELLGYEDWMNDIWIKHVYG
ncbi:MAG: hypothetical protein CMN73_02300 [Sphingomonas sp.]|nr:hypothetical protein [Sphingomonas sp.]